MKQLILIVVVVCAAAGCKAEPKKLSPDELIARLAASGVKVEKAGSYTNEAPAEMNMQLKLDGEEDFTAKRFPSVELATDYCQTKKHCFTIDYWSLQAFDSVAGSPAWAKVKEIPR